MLLTFSIIICFIFSYLANLVSLAPIVGAFIAGLIIDTHKAASYFGVKQKPLEAVLTPLSRVFVPIFFLK